MTTTPDYVWFNGPPKAYVGAYGATPPTDEIAYGAAWGTGWTDLGDTQGNLGLKPTFDTVVVDSDQHDGDVRGRTFRTASGLTFTIPGLNGTLEYILQALGGGVLTDADTETTLGYGDSGPFIDELSFGFEGMAPGSTADAILYRRVIIWSAIASTAPDDLDFQARKETVISGTYKAQIDTSKPAGERLFRFYDLKAA